MRTNLKHLTPEQFEQYTTEQAATLRKRFPDGRMHKMNMDFVHPLVQDFTGIIWNGLERDKWFETVDRKYRALKKKRASVR